METYNKIVMYIWWTVAIASASIITFMGFKQGFDRWAEYYVFTLMAVFIIVVRRFMMKRVSKNMKEGFEDKKE